jgi:hypothetical protein
LARWLVTGKLALGVKLFCGRFPHKYEVTIIFREAKSEILTEAKIIITLF